MSVMTGRISILLDAFPYLFNKGRIAFQKPADIFTGNTTSQHIGNDSPDFSFTVLLLQKDPFVFPLTLSDKNPFVLSDKNPLIHFIRH